jgi:mono/diheme cytochrome c family protein
MSRADIMQRFGTPDITKKRGRDEVWEYSDIGLTITFSPKETLLNWRFHGTVTPDGPSAEPAEIERHKESEIASSRPNTIEPLTPLPPPLVLPKDDPITEGRSLFNGKGGCYTCHGRDADMFTDVKQDLVFGSPPGYAPPPFTLFAGPSPRRVAPNLRDWFVLKRRTDLEMARAIKDGIAGTTMTATRHLNVREISALVAYLNSLR